MEDDENKPLNGSLALKLARRIPFGAHVRNFVLSIAGPNHSHRLARRNRFQTFWFEGPLNWVAELCIPSFVRFPGVEIHLYSYDKTSDPKLPGCIWVDANDILPYEFVAEYIKKMGYVAAGANLFRYKLLYEKGGWYFDTDCLLVKALDPFFYEDYVFARQDSDWINTAVIKFPRHHPMMLETYTECAQINPKEYRWGMAGPEMFTRYLTKFGLDGKALSPEYFYPIYFTNLQAFRSQFTSSENNFIVHLWNEMLRRQNWTRENLDESFLRFGLTEPQALPPRVTMP